MSLCTSNGLSRLLTKPTPAKAMCVGEQIVRHTRPCLSDSEHVNVVPAQRSCCESTTVHSV